MEILLIQPNYRKIYSYAGSKELTPVFPPFGLAYIAAVLRENGIETRIIEANALDLTHEQIKKIIEEEKDLKYVGVTATTSLIEEANKIAGLCPKNVKVIIGGIHASSLPEETLREFSNFDILVRGEGEFTILELIQGKPIEKIKGLSFRKGKKIIHNASRPLIEDLESLPLPARDLLPMEKYFSAGAKRQPADYILSSRGCPYTCNFCADHLVHGKKFRYRSAENVVKEVEFLIKEYGIKEFDFIDDNFTLLYDRVEKFCDLMIEKGLNKEIIWRCSNGVRIDRLNFELLKKMKNAGCYMLALGIESGNEEILRNIRKGINLDQVRNVVEWCNKIGIETRGLFMFGNLGEDEKTMEDTIKLTKELNLDTATFHITVPFPMTDYWKVIKKEGKLFPKNWVDYVAYGKVTFTHGKLNPELLLRMQKKAYKEFYIRPNYIFKKFMKIRSFKDLKMNIKGGLGILKFS